MHQQINLYQPVFRKQHKVFGASTLMQILGAVLVLLLAIFGHANWTLAGMQTSLEALQNQYDHMQAEVTVLEAALDTPDTDPLNTEIDDLRARIEQRNSLLEQFELLTVRHINGFSSQFRMLAEQNISGLWLNGVSLDREGQMEIRGTALDEKLVPRYLQQLQKLPGLSRTPFETVSMARDEADKPYIQFVLRNHKGATSWQ